MYRGNPSRLRQDPEILISKKTNLQLDENWKLTNYETRQFRAHTLEPLLCMLEWSLLLVLECS